MTTNPKHGRARLCAVPPGQIPDDRAAIARALLARYAPAKPVITDEMMTWLGWDAAALSEIESDPRYLIGRLTQALSALLAKDVPPPDATGQLMIEAITDAMAYRQPLCCGGECPRCAPQWRKAALYESLFGLLGLVGELPSPRPELTMVPR